MLFWRRRPAGKRLQVLRDGGEVEFVACPGPPPQPRALETVIGFEMGKAHLDLLAFVA